MLAGLLLVTADVAADSGIRSYMRHWMSYVIKSFYPEITWEEESLRRLQSCMYGANRCMREMLKESKRERVGVLCSVCYSGPQNYLLYIHFVNMIKHVLVTCCMYLL